MIIQPTIKHAPRVAVVNPLPGLPIKMASMHGMGDNLHQRALVRLLMQEQVVYLDGSPWPSIYHDLVGPRLQLVRPPAVTLRTQAKNAQREAALYQCDRAPRQVQLRRTWYRAADVTQAGSVLGAMALTMGVRGELDFRMPVPMAWHQQLDARIYLPNRPILLYRPLIERTEWGGCASRNPDFMAYRAVLALLRDQFFVVSVADLVPGKEWLADYPAPADLELHSGELTFEMLAALTRRAAVVLSSPGFAVPLAQAVGTPVICVFGGYENSSSFSVGARYTPYLGIDPIEPCSCFSHTHMHRKTIDLPAALARVQNFVDRNSNADIAQIGTAPAAACDRLDDPVAALHEPQRAGDPDRPDAAGAAKGGA
jgi:hypothetical protein